MSTEEETKKEEVTKTEEGGGEEDASPEAAECDAHFQPVVSSNGHPSHGDTQSFFFFSSCFMLI